MGGQRDIARSQTHRGLLAIFFHPIPPLKRVVVNTIATASVYGIVVASIQGPLAMSVLTEADSNSVKIVRQGEDVRLSLSESPSTGYRWTLRAEPPDAATIVSTRWTAGGAGVGAAGTREFVISVNEPGTVTLHAKLWREWEGEGSAKKRLAFTLQVH